MGLLDKVQDKVQDQLNKRNNNNNNNNNAANHPNAGTYDNTHTGTHNQGMVPGSHANNPNAIPTAGGQPVGGSGYNDSHGYNNPNVGGQGVNTNAGLHQTTGDKMQNALPGQHGNAHDAHGNSVDLDGRNQHSNVGHNNNSGIGGNSAYNNNNSHVGGPGGNSAYNNSGVHETAGDKMQNALPGQHGNAHDAHGNPVDLSGPGHNNHGSNTGGLVGSGAHNTHGTHNTHNTHNTHDTHNQHGHNTGPDNRGLMDKAKDAMSSKRSNQPDDPVTGTNYDQKDRNTHGGVGGTNDPYHQTGSGLHGNTTHGSNVHSTHNTHATHGNDNRGLMDKAKDAMSSKRSNHPDDPVTGTNYDQKNTGGVHGNTYNQQPGVGNTGAYNAPGDGRAPNY